jgi:hypothetical protein
MTCEPGATGAMESPNTEAIGQAAEPSAVYRASLIKRRRRTKAEIQALECGLLAILVKHRPLSMTVRQVFYQAIAHGFADKTEQEYDNTVCRLLTRLRKQGRLPFSWISDNSRWVRRARTYRGLQDALEATVAAYRRSIWQDQVARVEVWIEKDALAGVVSDITEAWDVPLFVVRGYASTTYLYAAADDAREAGKPTFVYYFGDHDPSGLDIARHVEKELRTYAPDVELHFAPPAVTAEQIARFNLPTRPTKTTDSRAKKFSGESVDLDALPIAEFRRLVTECIERHVDRDLLERLQRVEAAERRAFEAIANYNWSKLVGEFEARNDPEGSGWIA